MRLPLSPTAYAVALAEELRTSGLSQQHVLALLDHVCASGVYAFDLLQDACSALAARPAGCRGPNFDCTDWDSSCTGIDNLPRAQTAPTPRQVSPPPPPPAPAPPQRTRPPQPAPQPSPPAPQLPPAAPGSDIAACLAAAQAQVCAPETQSKLDSALNWLGRLRTVLSVVSLGSVADSGMIASLNQLSADGIDMMQSIKSFCAGKSMTAVDAHGLCEWQRVMGLWITKFPKLMDSAPVMKAFGVEALFKGPVAAQLQQCCQLVSNGVALPPWASDLPEPPTATSAAMAVLDAIMGALGGGHSEPGQTIPKNPSPQTNPRLPLPRFPGLPPAPAPPPMLPAAPVPGMPDAIQQAARAAAPALQAALPALQQAVPQLQKAAAAVPGMPDAIKAATALIPGLGGII